MSLAISRTTSTRQVLTRAFPWFAAAVAVGVLLLHLTTDFPRHLWSGGETDPKFTIASAVHAKIKPAEPPKGAATTVSLSEAKSKSAGVTTEKVRIERLAAEMGVAGRIEVDADRRVEIRSRVPSVVREVHAVLGQHVKRGDPLVTLDSPDVGTARLKLRATQRALLTARIEADWKAQIAETVASLAPQILKHVDAETLEKEFADKPLGAFRGILLDAYSQFDMAEREEAKTANLSGRQIIGEHPAILAKHTRQGFQAKLLTAVEQARFDAAQQMRLSHQALKAAEAAVIDAGQRLRILGVDEDVQRLIDDADKVDDAAVDDKVTVYQLVAPFEGSIITKSAVLSQRADPIDLLFTLADLSDVWVTASIPESELAKLPTIQGGPVRLSTTAYPGRTFDSKLLTVGSLVDPLTRTVPLLARADNREGLLRPGMFARILLDAPVSETVLTVPAASVVEIDGRAGVFRPEASDGDQPTFGLCSIVPGRQVGDRIVVKSGLKEGDLVVAGGAFALKSELILQNTPEED